MSGIWGNGLVVKDPGQGSEAQGPGFWGPWGTPLLLSFLSWGFLPAVPSGVFSHFLVGVNSLAEEEPLSPQQILNLEGLGALPSSPSPPPAPSLCPLGEAHQQRPAYLYSHSWGLTGLCFCLCGSPQCTNQ